MTTDCNPQQLEFQGVNRRTVVAAFDGGTLTSDAGVLLLGEVEKRRGILRQFAACFRDQRNPAFVEHSLEELIRQRVLGLALSYEDLNDHDVLRTDPLLATVVGKADPTGNDRRQEQDRGKPLAGKSTLNRLEWGAVKQDRYRKISVDSEAVDRFLVEVFLSAHESAPDPIILDLDATDDPLHGEQEGRFFHGYYGEYCYLPLYIFSGSYLLCARLRGSDRDASAGAVTEVERIVAQIRSRWPQVQIILRADSGFAREELMAWCEQQAVDYVFGLARNARLQRALGGELVQAREQFDSRGKPHGSSETSPIGRAKAGPASVGLSARPSTWPKAPIRVSLSPLCRLSRGLPQPCMSSCIALAAKWRIGSKSSSCACLPTVPPLTIWPATSCVCGCPRWPISCSTSCAGWAYKERKWLVPVVTPFGRSF